MTRIAIIGGGNMGEALLAGLLAAGTAQAQFQDRNFRLSSGAGKDHRRSMPGEAMSAARRLG
mgnify:CR=1 FL=1